MSGFVGPVLGTGGRRGKRVRVCGNLGESGTAGGNSDAFFRLGRALQRAVAEERYGDAARLRDELADVRGKDPLLRTRDALKVAVEEEDYKAAAQLRDKERELMRSRSLGEGFSLNRLLHLVISEGSDASKRRSSVVSTAPDGKVPILHENAIGGNVILSQPSWSPSGDYVALGRNVLTNRSVKSSLLIYDVFENKLLTELELDTTPFYFFWSRCGTKLTFLGALQPAGGALTFQTLDVQPMGRPRQMDKGAPYFFYDISRDNPQRILTHTGGGEAVKVYNLKDDPEKREPIVLAETPGLFRAPKWHPKKSAAGGQQALYVSRENDYSILHCQDLDGGRTSELLRVHGGSITFTISPDGTRLASLVHTSKGEDLSVVEGPFDADSEINERMASSAPVVNLTVPFSRVLAYFWSPDSRKILYLTGPANSAEMTNCRWNVYDFPSNVLARFEEHLPSSTFLKLYAPFFDQYALSHKFWAPDSSAFCYSAKSERFGGKDGPSFAWVQNLPEEMQHENGKASPRTNTRRIVKSPETPMPEPVLRDSELSTWSI